MALSRQFRKLKIEVKDQILSMPEKPTVETENRKLRIAKNIWYFLHRRNEFAERDQLMNERKDRIWKEQIENQERDFLSSTEESDFSPKR